MIELFERVPDACEEENQSSSTIVEMKWALCDLGDLNDLANFSLFVMDNSDKINSQDIQILGKATIYY